MFSLNDSMRYLLYNQPTDMRKSYHSLSGIETNILDRDPCNGDVYIFINKNRNRIKLLHWEPGGMVIYSKLLETGTLGRGPDIGGKTCSASSNGAIWFFWLKVSLRNRTVAGNVLRV